MSLGESGAGCNVEAVWVEKVPLELDGRGVPGWCGGKMKQMIAAGRSREADKVPG